MEVKRRRKYSREFKEDVVNMIKTGTKRVCEISKDLDLSEPMIYRWYSQYSGEDSPQEKELSEKDKELRALRKQLADVTEERDILKKAIRIFSKQGKSS